VEFNTISTLDIPDKNKLIDIFNNSKMYSLYKYLNSGKQYLFYSKLIDNITYEEIKYKIKNWDSG